MEEYRKRQGGVWHLYRNCSRWKAGKGTYTSKRSAKTPVGDLCDECRAKRRNREGIPF